MHNIFSKLFLLTILIVVCSVNSYSKGIELGIQAGPTVTKTIGKIAFKHNADIRYATEIYVKYSFTSKIGIRTGLGFEDKGYVIKGLTFADGAGNPLVSGKLHHHLQYITIPILAEFTFGKKLLPYFNTGFYLGILANSKDRYKYDDKTFNKSVETSSYNRFDMGFILGVGIKVPIKEKFLFNVDIRNSVGFLRTNKYNPTGSYKAINYSTAFNIGFAYKFGNKEVATK